MSKASEKRSPALAICATGFVIAWVVVASMPFLWTLWGSFKVQGDFFSKADWTNAIFGIRTTV